MRPDDFMAAAVVVVGAGDAPAVEVAVGSTSVVGVGNDVAVG